MNNKFFSKPQLIFLFVIAITVFLIKFIVIFHPFNILPREDELYYLFFSENLRFIYPDHTPMVAYFLAVARFIFNLLVPGNFEDYLPGSLALVPISSTIYFFFLYAFIYFFVSKIWNNKQLAILILFAFFLTPYLWGVAFITTPETPLTFFAFPAVLLFAHAFIKQPENLKVWLLAGLFLAGAFLGKILAIPLGVAIALYAVISPNRKLYLTNYRFYLAFSPAIIAGLVILYADSLDNFSMIRTLFIRNGKSTNIDTILNVFFNQFIYYTPLFYALSLFLPTAYILASLKRKESATSSANINDSSHFLDQLLFFFAVVSVFCMAFLFYKLFTISMLNWWSGFTAAPNILFVCTWLQKKLSSHKKRKWQKIIIINFSFTALFCTFATFHTLYGILDPKYNPQQRHPANYFPVYNNVINTFASKFDNFFGKYPKENGDYLYDHSGLVNNFKKYYETHMDKSLPIVGVNFRSSLYIYYSTPNSQPPRALTKRNFISKNFTVPISKVDDYSIFDYLFHLDELSNKSYYLVDFRKNFYIKKRNDYEVVLESPIEKKIFSPTNCTLEKIFINARVSKIIGTHALYYCQNGSNFKKTSK